MQKRIISLVMTVTLLFVMLIPVGSVSAASNPYPYQHNLTSDGHYVVNCTWYAWQLAYERCGVALPGFGNAGQWYDQAAAYGYSVGSTPAANSIVVWTDGSFGHVAFVSQVSGSQIYVEEGGFDSASCPDGIHQGWTSAAAGSDRYGQILKGYIYLDNVPEQKPVQDPWVEVQSITEITETNARLNALIHNPSGKYITTVGVYVMDPEGNLISEHYEPIASGYNTYDGVKMWYNITQELGLTLERATTYTFQMLCIAGDGYFTDLYTFSTLGSYTLSFDANGGTCDTSAVSIHRGDVYALPTPTREGYVFTGWSTAPTGSNLVASGDKYMTRGDQTLYAQWSQSYIAGDVDFSGVVDVADIMKIKDLIMKESCDANQLSVGDLNHSGNLDVGDIMGIKSIIMGA